jgi:hypothetical protein
VSLILFLYLFDAKPAPIALHPDNPHYFIYEDNPTVLVASGEHYSAVINMDFDFKTYLKILNKTGLNHTRIFLGDYVEEPDAFCITENTLSPLEGRFISSWQRSGIPGFTRGGNKFDLDTWNTDYFVRLHDFMSLAEDNGVIVEAVLFFAGCLYRNSPFHHSNNINETDKIHGNQYMTLDNGNILIKQEEYSRRLVHKLNEYDILIINVANEPWFDNQEHPGFASPPHAATTKWILQVSEWIKNAEANLPNKHLISVDYTKEGRTRVWV